MSELKDLIARVEALNGADREVDAAICVTTQYGGLNSEGATNVRVDLEWGENELIFEIGEEECCNPIPNLTSSIDAALAFAERELPGWFVRMITPDTSASSLSPSMVPFAEIVPNLDNDEGWQVGSQKASAPTLPLAIILATLKAKVAE